jgi:hypothetical protein
MASLAGTHEITLIPMENSLCSFSATLKLMHRALISNALCRLESFPPAFLVVYFNSSTADGINCYCKDCGRLSRLFVWFQLKYPWKKLALP